MQLTRENCKGIKMYEYRCKILKVVDGDTVDVDIT